jgi:hypothetical protein
MLSACVTPMAHSRRLRAFAAESGEALRERQVTIPAAPVSAPPMGVDQRAPPGAHQIPSNYGHNFRSF